MDQLVLGKKKAPILPPIKIESELNAMKKKRRRLELGLKEALLMTQRKSAWRRKQIKKNLCQLDIIPEDSEHDSSVDTEDFCEDEMKQIEDLNVKIEALEFQQFRNKERDPELRDMKHEAEILIEEEFQ